MSASVDFAKYGRDDRAIASGRPTGFVAKRSGSRDPVDDPGSPVADIDRSIGAAEDRNRLPQPAQERRYSPGPGGAVAHQGDPENLPLRPLRDERRRSDRRTEPIGHDGNAADRGMLVEDRGRSRRAGAGVAALAVARGESPVLASTHDRHPIPGLRRAEVVALIHRDDQV